MARIYRLPIIPPGSYPFTLTTETEQARLCIIHGCEPSLYPMGYRFNSLPSGTFDKWMAAGEIHIEPDHYDAAGNILPHCYPETSS